MSSPSSVRPLDPTLQADLEHAIVRAHGRVRRWQALYRALEGEIASLRRTHRIGALKSRERNATRGPQLAQLGVVSVQQLIDRELAVLAPGFAQDLSDEMNAEDWHRATFLLIAKVSSLYATLPREAEEPFSEGFWAGRMSDRDAPTADVRERAYRAYRAGDRYNVGDDPRALQDRVGDPWHPIATAPTDGSWFWVRRDPPREASAITVSAFKWDAAHGMWFAGTGWWHQWSMGFTHWTPMAAQPPAPDGEGGA